MTTGRRDGRWDGWGRWVSWRVTRYDPARRDWRGAYPGDEWTGCRDMGRAFRDDTLTPGRYLACEDAYVAVAAWPALATGVRRGEALGPMWRDADPKRKRVFIGRQRARDRRLRAPRGERFIRWVGVGDRTVLFLRERKVRPSRGMEIQGMDQNPEAPHVVDLRAHRPQRLLQAERAVLRRARPRPLRGDHAAYAQRRPRRHQAGPRRLQPPRAQAHAGDASHGQGADIRTARHRLGHSGASLAMDACAHAIPSSDGRQGDGQQGGSRRTATLAPGLLTGSSRLRMHGSGPGTYTRDIATAPSWYGPLPRPVRHRPQHVGLWASDTPRRAGLVRSNQNGVHSYAVVLLCVSYADAIIAKEKERRR